MIYNPLGPPCCAPVTEPRKTPGQSSADSQGPGAARTEVSSSLVDSGERYPQEPSVQDNTVSESATIATNGKKARPLQPGTGIAARNTFGKECMAKLENKRVTAVEY